MVKNSKPRPKSGTFFEGALQAAKEIFGMNSSEEEIYFGGDSFEEVFGNTSEEDQTEQTEQSEDAEADQDEVPVRPTKPTKKMPSVPSKSPKKAAEIPALAKKSPTGKTTPKPKAVTSTDFHHLEETDCTACMSPYSSKKDRGPVECACGYSSCVECYKSYIILGLTPAKCMSCGTHWSNKFLLEKFGTWVDSNAVKGYRTHLKNIIFEMQKARIPELIMTYGNIADFSEDRKRIEEIQKEVIELRQKAEAIMDQVHALEDESHDLNRRQASYKNGISPGPRISSPETSGIKAKSSTPPKPPPPPKVVCKCPYDECKGLILASEGEKLKCMIDASHLICKQCHEKVGEDTEMGGIEKKKAPAKASSAKGGVKVAKPKALASLGPPDVPKVHRCLPSTVKSVEFISGDSTPCPTCGAPVNKIEGCNAMWCTQCHAGFDYRTGRVTVTTHNPHLIEWQMRNGNKKGVKEIFRNPEDIPCDEIIPANQFQRYLEPFDKKYSNLIVDVTRVVREIEAEAGGEDRTISARRVYGNSHDYSMLMYLTNVYTEQELKNAIFRKQREDARLETRAQIYDTARTLLIEKTRELYEGLVEAEPASFRKTTKTQKVPAKLPLKIVNIHRQLFDKYREECREVREFINETFESEMTPLGSTSFPEITKEWVRR